MSPLFLFLCVSCTLPLSQRWKEKQSFYHLESHGRRVVICKESQGTVDLGEILTLSKNLEVENRERGQKNHPVPPDHKVLQSLCPDPCRCPSFP